jgi:DNA-binding NarL/FixJ family response regulator
MAARSGEILRAGNLGTFLRYTGAVRTKLLDAGHDARLGAPTSLTGLPNLQSQIAVPLKTSTQVIGIIAVESEQPAAFDEIDQELLLLVAGQTAQLIDRLRQAEQLRHAQAPQADTRFTLMNTLLQAVTSEPAASFLDHLTKREREVAAYVAQGMSNPEIAEALGLSVRTITTHLERIYDKLDVRSRSALTHYLYRQFL